MGQHLLWFHSQQIWSARPQQRRMSLQEPSRSSSAVSAAFFDTLFPLGFCLHVEPKCNLLRNRLYIHDFQNHSHRLSPGAFRYSGIVPRIIDLALFTRLAVDPRHRGLAACIACLLGYAKTRLPFWQHHALASTASNLSVGAGFST